jgi:hypothetical protein
MRPSEGGRGSRRLQTYTCFQYYYSKVITGRTIFTRFEIVKSPRMMKPKIRMVHLYLESIMRHGTRAGCGFAKFTLLQEEDF